MPTTSTITDKHLMVDRRRVAVHRQPADGDRAVIFFHPAPGAGMFDPDPAVTADRDVTLIEIDRPGYGGSDPVKPDAWATVASAADDAAAVLDHLGIARVGAAGWSAGGRVALALAARRPDLVERVAILGTPAPHEEVPWIPDEIAAGIEALRGLPPHEVVAAMGGQLGPVVAAAGEDSDVGLEMLGRSAADDAALARPGARERVLGLLRAAFAQGEAGVVADIAGYTLRPWGFETSKVRAKTLLLYGSADPVGPAHGRWWQGTLPNARLEVVPDAGHLLVLPMWKRVLSHLAPRHAGAA